MTTTDAALLMTMSDIAELAHVRRPVVSMWRSRAAASDLPFPAPVAHNSGQDMFDARRVADWLTTTKRGNNPDALADAAAHAALDRADATEQSTFYPLSALLALRSVIARPLAALSRDDLLDAADEQDPDDDLFYREIENLADPSRLCAYVDTLVEAAYSEPAAFEKLMADRFKLGLRALGDTALGETALHLVAEAATALAATQPGNPVYVDVTGSASDVLVAIAEAERDAELTVITANDDSVAARLLRRRLLVHRIDREGLSVAEGVFAVTGHVVHVAQFPPASDPHQTPEQTLSAIDNITLQMGDDQLGIIFAPASVLTDARLTRQAELLRSQILRSGRLRAVIRLAPGLLPHKPTQAQALWVLGAAHSHVELANRWTLVADLSTVELDPAATADLVSDLVASLGDRATVRAHAFRFARLVLTRTLLARHGSLVSGAQLAGQSTPAPLAHSVALAVQAEQVINDLNVTERATADAPGLRLIIESTTSSETSIEAVRSTIEQLIAERTLRYIAGNRLELGDITESTTEAAGIRVIGPAEVSGERALGQHRIDRLHFAAAYSSGRVTEPGDVVFATSPRPCAMVDTEGTSVVAYPARILRINSAHPDGLLSEVIAADITALPETDTRWRRWNVRRVHVDQQAALGAALLTVRAQRQRAQQRLARLDNLTELLMTGVTGGAFTVTHDSQISAVLSKGTP